jgi:hypothetical protein
MLRTASATSAIVMKKNHLYASCPQQNCDYVVTDENVPSVTAVTYNADDMVLTLDETTLEFEQSDVTIFLDKS